MTLTKRTSNGASMKTLLVLAMMVGIVLALKPVVVVLVGVFLGSFLLVIQVKQGWRHSLWTAIIGLALFSYGFNNIPVPPTPAPLVDVLLLYALVGSLPIWWRLRSHDIVRRLVVVLVFLSLVAGLRLLVDIPRFGLLAVRDALYVFELWTLFPAIAMGFWLGDMKGRRYLNWLFGLALAWFLLYPFREVLLQWSPMVGIQRPVPLLAFTTAGFLSVPALFWFLRHTRRITSVLGVTAALVVVLFVQARGVYLALIAILFLLLFLRPGDVPRWGKLVAAFLLGLFVLTLIGPIPGRLGEPVGLNTVIEQLRTLFGDEGPGAGSFRHRLEAWPYVIGQVLESPLGPIWGIGYGPDLFQEFTVGPGVLVRKPHNDFLEIWARTGILGLIPWLSLLIILGTLALKAARQDPRNDWVLALQIMLWFASLGQPAMGFAYITMVWTGLTGLWLGMHLRQNAESVGGTKGGTSHAHTAHPQPLPPTRR